MMWWGGAILFFKNTLSTCERKFEFQKHKKELINMEDYYGIEN